MDIRMPIYHVNQIVKSAADLYNDGTYPDRGKEELLIPYLTKGIVVQTGLHEESGTPVYMVDFDDKMVLGVFEEEITPWSE